MLIPPACVAEAVPHLHGARTRAKIRRIINRWNHQWGFPKMKVVPNNKWFVMENPIEMDDVGVRPCQETSIIEYTIPTRLEKKTTFEYVQSGIVYLMYFKLTELCCRHETSPNIHGFGCNVGIYKSTQPLLSVLLSVKRMHQKDLLSVETKWTIHPGWNQWNRQNGFANHLRTGHFLQGYFFENPIFAIHIGLGVYRCLDEPSGVKWVKSWVTRKPMKT